MKAGCLREVIIFWAVIIVVLSVYQYGESTGKHAYLLAQGLTQNALYIFYWIYGGLLYCIWLVAKKATGR